MKRFYVFDTFLLVFFNVKFLLLIQFTMKFTSLSLLVNMWCYYYMVFSLIMIENERRAQHGAARL